MSIITSLFIGGEADGRFMDTEDRPNYRIPVPNRESCLVFNENPPTTCEMKVDHYKLERWHSNNIIFTFFVEEKLNSTQAFSKLINGYKDSVVMRKELEKLVEENITLKNINAMLMDVIQDGIKRR